jgi:hypothetical protein
MSVACIAIRRRKQAIRLRVRKDDMKTKGKKS